jgi:hypothetical protein
MLTSAVCAFYRLGLCVLVLAQALVDACSDPLDYWQDVGALVTYLFHLSVISCLAKWINDMNCFQW